MSTFIPPHSLHILFNCLFISSDLWVASDGVPNSNNTGKNTSVKYAIGEATGPIKYADLTFAGYAVPHQAFCELHLLNINYI